MEGTQYLVSTLVQGQDSFQWSIFKQEIIVEFLSDRIRKKKKKAFLQYVTSSKTYPEGRVISELQLLSQQYSILHFSDLLMKVGAGIGIVCTCSCLCAILCCRGHLLHLQRTVMGAMQAKFLLSIFQINQ